TQNARARQAVSRVSREELEDRFLRQHDENILLKQHAHRQEDKIRRKRAELAGSGVRALGRDVELEQMMEELQDKVQELEKQNESLRQRLIATKQQLQVQGHRHSPYGHVQPRINSGLRRARNEVTMQTPQMQQTQLSKGLRGLEPDASARATQTALPRYGHSLLDDARAEIRNLYVLENVVESQRGHMEELEGMVEMQREQLRKREREYEEALLQLREQQTTGQRSTIKDNVEMIKLQKQLSEKGNTFTVLEGRFVQLQEKQKTLKASHDAVMSKVDELNALLKKERLKSLSLEQQLQAVSLARHRAEELQDRVTDLEKERDLLKENYDKLFNRTHEQQWKTREKQLNLQIAQLEVALKSDLTDKNEILDKIKQEREQNEILSQQNQELRLRVLEQKQQFDEIKDRMKFFTKESDIDVAELSEALMLIKVRKNQKNGELEFLEKAEDNVNTDVQRSMRELQANHADTVQELEKTRNMLIMQHKINKEYQTEVEAVTHKMEDIKQEYELELEKLAQLLDMRAARIRKLEAQLKDVAYGTKQHTFRRKRGPADNSDPEVDEFDETLHLERGENLFELHVERVSFSPEALQALGDREPTTFCTYAFYDFELQATPVVRGSHPVYSFTSQYQVRVDDFFLQYLQTSAVTLEVQLAEGTAYQTFAACQLRLHDLLDRNGKVFGTAPLVGVGSNVKACGTAEYWLRLRIPMDQAVRLYRERVKALGYLASNHRGAQQEEQVCWPALLSPASTEGSLNELHITVQHCSDLRSRQPEVQPSPYVMYKFFDFADHDTAIVPSSNDPHYDNHMSFPVPMNADLDRYLKSEVLWLYVFDDADTQGHLYLGKAKVPLISLAHDKGITGTFELLDPEGSPSGTINVTLKWSLSYLPPRGSSMTVEQAKFVPREVPEKLSTEEEKSKLLPTVPPISTTQVTTALRCHPLPKPRQRLLLKDTLTSKKVSFVDVADPESLVSQGVHLSLGAGVSGWEQMFPVSDFAFLLIGTDKLGKEQRPQSTQEEEEEEEEEDSRISEGQLAANGSLSSEEESISEELPQYSKEGDDALATDLNESILSDSDDCIVPAQASQGRKQPSERIRIEVVSLRLKPDSRISKDDSIQKLFVEFKLLNLPNKETPLSLPKPRAGQSIHYNCSTVIHVDVENNKARREILKSVLQGAQPEMESIKFTVVSEPPENEQDEDCEDVGVAFLRIRDVLEEKRDLVDRSLDSKWPWGAEAIVG
ncbi:FTM protein, partial [Amia calva]|nr:FTM protein [Amia calva]